jgi:hypothetical protein
LQKELRNKVENFGDDDDSIEAMAADASLVLCEVMVGQIAMHETGSGTPPSGPKHFGPLKQSVSFRFYLGMGRLRFVYNTPCF